MKKKDYIKAVIIILPIIFVTYSAVMYFLNYLTDGVGSVDLRKSGGISIILCVVLILSMKRNADKKRIQNKE